MYLCACTNCKNIFVDPNPQDSDGYSENLLGLLEIKSIVYQRGLFVCPECRVDIWLTDDIAWIFTQREHIAQANKYRSMFIEAAKKLDLLTREGFEDYEKIRNLVTDKRFHKDIYQMIESDMVDIPTGRQLSYTEREKIGNYFNNEHAFNTQLSRDGKIYFGYLDGEDNEPIDGKIRVWGYITEEQINNILKPKPKEKPKAKNNEVLNSLSWYKKLMKNIK